MDVEEKVEVEVGEGKEGRDEVEEMQEGRSVPGCGTVCACAHGVGRKERALSDLAPPPGVYVPHERVH